MLITESQIRRLIQSKLIKTLLKEADGDDTISNKIINLYKTVFKNIKETDKKNDEKIYEYLQSLGITKRSGQKEMTDTFNMLNKSDNVTTGPTTKLPNFENTAENYLRGNENTGTYYYLNSRTHNSSIKDALKTLIKNLNTGSVKDAWWINDSDFVDALERYFADDSNVIVVLDADEINRQQQKPTNTQTTNDQNDQGKNKQAGAGQENPQENKAEGPAQIVKMVEKIVPEIKPMELKLIGTELVTLKPVVDSIPKIINPTLLVDPKLLKSLDNIKPPTDPEKKPAFDKILDGIVKSIGEKIAPNVPQSLNKNLKCWFKFPQLNGGYFEMAKILMDKTRIADLHNTSRKYKNYEKQGQMYGLLKADGGKPDDPQINDIVNFFSDGTTCATYITAYLLSISKNNNNPITKFANAARATLIAKKIVNNNKFVGKCLDEFFKNHMMKVGEYYLIDQQLLSFIILRASAGIINVDDDQGIKNAISALEARTPKIIKAKFSPSNTNDLDSDENNQKDASKGYTIKKMFNDRAKDAFEATPPKEQQVQKNLTRANREKVYK